MVKIAGWLMVFFGVAHTTAALTFDKAARHAGTWFSGGLWHEATHNFTPMSQAGAAFWFSIEIFGPPMLVIGLIILWMDRRGITPPTFIAWILGVLALLDAIILLPTPWPLMVLAVVLLLLAARRDSLRERTIDAPVHA
ncbi:hypothetical protein GPX89_10310 [Nocardia sp. ET3-3]|uniref:Uncharacterized protein n=1 Tax=Nocardia terrae TaxID=2675851 RepID=A0A7K1UTN0_9NOCA|nr:DUF6463 family protein [Nocardia terrae]MVU77631.1 hypothetical protein [Nocardia terrae]